MKSTVAVINLKIFTHDKIGETKINKKLTYRLCFF